jgi:hypothetical protein
MESIGSTPLLNFQSNAGYISSALMVNSSEDYIPPSIMANIIEPSDICALRLAHVRDRESFVLPNNFACMIALSLLSGSAVSGLHGRRSEGYEMRTQVGIVRERGNNVDGAIAHWWSL